MDIIKIGQKVDMWWHSLNPGPCPNKTTNGFTYGRGLEQASGLGFILIAMTMLFGENYGISQQTLHLHNFLWAYLALVLAACQLWYTGLVQRRVFNLMATAGWITLALGAYIAQDGINLLSAVALPYCLCSFYVYGFLLGVNKQ
jgi:hypothetical protein